MRASCLAVSDRITVTLSVPEEKVEWITRHREHVAAEVLATSLEITTESLAGATVHDVVRDTTATVAKN